MDIPSLPGLNPSAGTAVEKRGRGRPKGATNKRSADLVRYIEAFYGGMTPGQQAAAIGLVTPREVRQAKAKAKELGLHPTIAALAIKAQALATALGCTKAEAWDLMRRERTELMPYVHQRRPLAVEIEGGGMVLPLVVLGGGGVMGGGATLEGEWSEVEENQRLNSAQPVQVAQPKSHDEG